MPVNLPFGRHGAHAPPRGRLNTKNYRRHPAYRAGLVAFRLIGCTCDATYAPRGIRAISHHGTACQGLRAFFRTLDAGADHLDSLWFLRVMRSDLTRVLPAAEVARRLYRMDMARLLTAVRGRFRPSGHRTMRHHARPYRLARW